MQTGCGRFISPVSTSSHLEFFDLLACYIVRFILLDILPVNIVKKYVSYEDPREDWMNVQLGLLYK